MILNFVMYAVIVIVLAMIGSYIGEKISATQPMAGQIGQAVGIATGVGVIFWQMNKGSGGDMMTF